jgi:hypothetical protein
MHTGAGTDENAEEDDPSGGAIDDENHDEDDPSGGNILDQPHDTDGDEGDYSPGRRTPQEERLVARARERFAAAHPRRLGWREALVLNDDGTIREKLMGQLVPNASEAAAGAEAAR